MTIIELWINGTRHCFKGPAGWSETSPEQAIGIMRLRRLAQARNTTGTPAGLFPALSLLYGLKPRHQRWLFDERFLRSRGLNAVEPVVTLLDGSGDGEREMALKQGQLLIDTVRWIGEDQPGTRFLVPHFRATDYRFGSPALLLKKTRHQSVYHAPADALGDATFEEFAQADKSFRSNDLAKLAAVLYRPGKTGEREPLNQKSLTTRTDAFSQLEPALFDLIAAQYESTLRYLQSCFKHVFPVNQSDTKQAKNRVGNWLDVAIGMAKMDATKIGEIEQLNVYLALKVLNEQLRQAEEMEAQLEKMRQRK